MKVRLLTVVLMLQLLTWAPSGVHSKPALDEENRNLCEGEDMAACLQEVEDAKSRSAPPDDDAKQDVTKDGNGSEDDTYEMLRAVDENSKFWSKEVKSMNKWDRYGMA